MQHSSTVRYDRITDGQPPVYVGWGIGREITQSKNVDAMGNDAKARTREFFWGKHVQRRETGRRLKNVHRRETQKHFRYTRPAMIIYYFSADGRHKLCHLNVYLKSK